MPKKQVNWGKKLESGQTDDPTLKLAAELQDKSNHPATAVAPTQFKTDLRRQLIEQHPTSTRSVWSGLGQLLRSGTAFAVLAVAVVFIWFIMSRPEQINTPSYGDDAILSGGPPHNQTDDINAIVTRGRSTAVVSNATIPTRTPFPTMTPPSPEDGDVITLANYDIPTGPLFAGDTITATLYWEAHTPLQTDWIVSLQLLDVSGPIAQVDEPPTLPSTQWVMNELITDTHTLIMPADTPPGMYRLKAILYNPVTGERYPHQINGIDLGNLLYIVQPTTPIPPTAVANGDTLHIQSITQSARDNANDIIHYTVVISYQLQSTDFGLFRLSMVHPEWESLPQPTDPSQRVPVDSVTNFIPIANGQGTLTLNFDIMPNEKTIILDTTQPVFMAAIIDIDQENIKIIYVNKTFTEYPLSLDNLAEVHYP